MATTRRRSKKVWNNNLLIFLALIIVLALISMVMAYFMTDHTENNEKIKTPGNKSQVIVPIEGTWVSNYNGTMLTIKGQQITLELPSVDKPGIIKGKIAIGKNSVTFIYENGPCKSVEGHYQYSLNEKGELFFKLIGDNCPARREMMSASWFKL